MSFLTDKVISEAYTSLIFRKSDNKLYYDSGTTDIEVLDLAGLAGLDADTLDGLDLHTGRNHEANKVVRTDGSGYIQAGWINTTSGAMAVATDLTRIYCSDDSYMRYMTNSNFKVKMGLSGQTDYDRQNYTSGTTYMTGANSHNDVTFDGLLQRGCGFIDNWNGGAGKPPSGSHWNGFQALHYASGTSYFHGMQMAMAAGNPSNTYLRGWWANGGSGYGWQKIWTDGNDGSGSGLDADLLDGMQPNSSNVASTIVSRNSAGDFTSRYIFAEYFNQSSSNSENPTIGAFWTNSTADNYNRKSTPAHVISQLGLFTTSNDGSGSGLDADLLDGVDSVKYFKSPSNVSAWERNNANFSVRGGDSSNVGLHMEQSNGGFGFQLYGASGTYGFLDGEWAGWDIQKVANGAFSVDEGSGLQRVWNAGNDGSGSGLDADLLDGVQGSGYARLGGTEHQTALPYRWFATADYDNNIDYYQHNYAKAHMGNTYKYSTSRPHITSDSNYWVGSMGWGEIDLNTIFSYGSGFWDSWSTPGNAPSGTTHWNGLNALHYSSNTGNSQYGMQQAMGAGNPSLFFVRGIWGGGFTSWRKIWNDGNDGSGSGLDADLLDGQHGSYYSPTSHTHSSYLPLSGGTLTGNLVVPSSTIRIGGSPSTSVAGIVVSTTGRIFNSRGSGVTPFTHMSFQNGNGFMGTIGTSGSVCSYVSNSDYRLKENVVAIDDAVARVKALKPWRFNFKATPSQTLDGFIAHEVQEAGVEYAAIGTKDEVDENGDPEYQGVDYAKFTPLLTAALQKALERIETLEAKVATLEG